MRGEAIHERLGQNLPRSFPVVDIFKDGIVTSIKSIDLLAKSYHDAVKIIQVGRKYVDLVAEFKGGERAGAVIEWAQIKGRAVVLAVPRGATAAQNESAARRDTLRTFERRKNPDCGDRAMKSAVIYQRVDGWYVCAVSTTTEGVGVAWPPHMKIALRLDAAALGHAVVAALKASAEAVRHPSSSGWAELFKPMLALAEVKSWSEFARHTLSVHVRIDGREYLIEPWKNAGSRQGFVPIPDDSKRISVDSSMAEIGDAIKHTLVGCA